jgi:hypothetical protein
VASSRLSRYEGSKKEERSRVPDLDQRSLRAVGDSTGRIGGHGVRHERVAALAEREEHRERDGLVAVPELPRE